MILPVFLLSSAKAVLSETETIKGNLLSARSVAPWTAMPSAAETVDILILLWGSIGGTYRDCIYLYPHFCRQTKSVSSLEKSSVMGRGVAFCLSWVLKLQEFDASSYSVCSWEAFMSCWLPQGRLKHAVALVLIWKILLFYCLLSASAHGIGLWCTEMGWFG